MSFKQTCFLRHCLIGCFVLNLCAQVEAATRDVEIGANAPSFEITTLDGHSISLSELNGKKPVYLKFWATWCIACLKEMPHFSHAYQRYGEDIEFVAVNVAINDTLERIAATQAKFNLKVPIYYDESGELQTKYNFLGTPTHVVIDVRGKIVHLGFSADGALDQTLEIVSKETNN